MYQQSILEQIYKTNKEYYSDPQLMQKLPQEEYLAQNISNLLDGLVIKTEADTVNKVSANQRAKRWAMMNFDKWNEVTGFVDPHISYYDEIAALIEDAVEFGYGVVLKQPLREIMKVIKKSEGSL